MKKTMVIGLGPEYNYDVKNHQKWVDQNTRYASNHGASLISRTLIEFFNADYIDDFSRIEEYRNTYDLCVIAFATHVTDWRNVNEYTNFIKKLNIKTVAFSLGVQDYSKGINKIGNVHSSLKELLQFVINTSGFIGVRGPFTASVLIKSGFHPKYIKHFGCPTLFKPLKRDLTINKKNKFLKPIIVYHRTMAQLNTDFFSSATILGQDFLDEVIFSDNIPTSQLVKQNELEEYAKYKNGDHMLKLINENGVFNKTFDEWFSYIGEYDFVIGARLHGCIAALLQGIPAVMLARDQRVKEMAEFYQIPFITYEDLGKRTMEEIYDSVDFDGFNNLYKYRFDNFVKLMDDLKILNRIEGEFKIPESYYHTELDIHNQSKILYDEVKQINDRLRVLDEKIELLSNRYNQVKATLKKIPGIKNLIGILK